jgi:hypothetical protein
LQLYLVQSLFRAIYFGLNLFQLNVERVSEHLIQTNQVTWGSRVTDLAGERVKHSYDLKGKKKQSYELKKQAKHKNKVMN